MFGQRSRVDPGMFGGSADARSLGRPRQEMAQNDPAPGTDLGPVISRPLPAAYPTGDPQVLQ